MAPINSRVLRLARKSDSDISLTHSFHKGSENATSGLDFRPQSLWGSLISKICNYTGNVRHVLGARADDWPRPMSCPPDVVRLSPLSSENNGLQFCKSLYNLCMYVINCFRSVVSTFYFIIIIMSLLKLLTNRTCYNIYKKVDVSKL